MSYSPKCPWCGNVMYSRESKAEPRQDGNGATLAARFVCTTCGAGSPVVEDKTKGCSEILLTAYEVACTPYKQEPIELYPDRDYRDVMGNDCLIPIYIEHRFTTDIEAGIYDTRRNLIYFAFNESWRDNEEQGVSWRAWLRKPTDRERMDAPWKEIPDEGLTVETMENGGNWMPGGQNVKMPCEIKKGLALCSQDICVKDGECPYAKNCDECGEEFQLLKAHALSYINELEERIDLMKIQMQGDCGVCKRREARDEICAACLRNDRRPAWQYEGLPEVKTR